MTPDDLDRILSSQDDLQPSSGFAERVMAAALQPDAAPPALKFPWFRFAAGVAASVAMAGAGTALLLDSGPALIRAAAPLAAVAPVVGYAALAALLSLGFAALPRLLVRR